MNISLRRGERIYINGAVIRVDRKVSIELLNDVTFLLENHVMQAEDASTPVRRLYFVLQTILMSPNDCDPARKMCGDLFQSLTAALQGGHLYEGLETANRLFLNNRLFEALKILRTLFPIEQQLINRDAPASSPPVEASRHDDHQLPLSAHDRTRHEIGG